MCRKTTLTEKQLKEDIDEEVDVFTDEYSNQSSEEIEKEQRNDISLTSIFEIVLSRADGNYLIYILNNLVFEVTLNFKDMR